mmetsp:Transcript_44480/g.117752  ORF Transcript_44480/g.117752 Transcript_44480/m.117752 type:complete len:204 (+) Transcript_44480:38-649(+)
MDCFALPWREMRKGPAEIHGAQTSIFGELKLHCGDVLLLVDARHLLLSVCKLERGPLVHRELDEALDHHDVRVLDAHRLADLAQLRAVVADAHGDDAGVVSDHELHQVLAALHLRRGLDHLGVEVHAARRRLDTAHLPELGRLQGDRRHACRDDVREGRLQRSPTHQEPVNVSLCDKLLAIVWRHTPSIKDPNRLCHLLRHRL